MKKNVAASAAEAVAPKKPEFSLIDEDFRFQITQTEFSGLISKFLISNRGGTRKMPYAYTDHAH